MEERDVTAQPVSTAGQESPVAGPPRRDSPEARAPVLSSGSGQGADVQEPPQVVAMVCSAGGLPALRRVLGPLPADFPAVVVVL